MLVIFGLLWATYPATLSAQSYSERPANDERLNFGLTPSTQHTPSEFGSYALYDPQGDPQRFNYQAIGTPGWGARISLAENGEYYAVYKASQISHLRIYKNSGDPAVDPWEYVISIVFAGDYGGDLEIEACSSVPRIFVFYGLELPSFEQDVEMFWFLMPDPLTNGFVSVVEEVEQWCVTTDEVEYNGVIYLYLAYSVSVQGMNWAVGFMRSLDWGFTWQDAELVDLGEGYFTMHEDCIAYCPGNNRVLLMYFQLNDHAVYVARSLEEYGLGYWELTPVFQAQPWEHIEPRGITCSLGSHILSTGYMYHDNHNVVYFYSNDGGDTWSGVQELEREGSQSIPSCASNRHGYFSIAYLDFTGSYCASMLNFWDQLGNVNAWTPVALTSLRSPHFVEVSACLEEGDPPRHGAVWDDTHPSQCYFGWAQWNQLLITYVSQYFDSWPYGSNPIPADRELIIENGGTVSQSWYTAENISWLTVSPTSGVLMPLQIDTLLCSYVSPWPGAGMHTGTVTITAPGAQGSPQDVLFTLYCSMTNTPLTVDVVPHNPPIHVPYGGGSFQFHFVVANPSSAPASFDFWTDIVKPNGAHTPPRLGPFYDRTWGPNYTFTSSEKTQSIPWNAPAGMYSYVGYLGDFPNDVWQVDYFTFIKDGPPLGEGAVASSSDPADWESTEESSLADAQTATAMLGAIHELPLQLACSPNPFNAATTLRFDLPEPAQVALEVFDVNGRPVVGAKHSLNASPLSMWYPAGSHEIPFDGSHLPSGIYFARLTIEGWQTGMDVSPLTWSALQSQVQKLVLLK